MDGDAPGRVPAALQREGALRALEHPPHVTAREGRADECCRGLDRAGPVRHRPTPRCPARRREGRIALGVAAQEVHRPGLDDAEPTIRRDGGGTESVQPTGEGRHPSPLDRLEVVPANDVGREVEIAGLDRVANGAVGIAGAVVPIGGTPVQHGQATWLPPRELQLEQVRQQRVVAVHLAPIVERGDEHVRPFERGQPLRRPGLLGQRVRERAGDRVDDGRREHELERVRLEGRQDLLGEVVEDVAVRTAEGGDELFPVLGGPHRQVGEIQPGGPPVGPLVERGHAVGRQPEIQRRVHQHGRLLWRELQVGRPELHQLLSGTEPGDRQRRIGARRDGELHARRGELDHAHDRLVAFVGVDEVVVVEDEHHAGRGRLQFGEERGCGIGFAGERPEPIRSLLTFGRQPERRTDVRPEHGRVVVLPIDRDPGKGAGIDVRPVGQQRGLSEPGRRDHQGQRGPGSHERPCQSRPTDRSVAQDRLMQLRCLEDGPPGGLPSGFVAHAGTRPRLRALEAPKFSPTMGADTTYTTLVRMDQPGPRTTCALRSGSARRAARGE